jgi:argininosuccinate lyase
VRKGVPFRQAHHHAGELVALAEKKTRESGVLVSMSQLSLAEFKAVNDKFEADITDKQWWSFERSAESRNVIGGTSKSSIKEQIKYLREFMANQ